jgi:hypothetical protein
MINNLTQPHYPILQARWTRLVVTGRNLDQLSCLGCPNSLAIDKTTRIDWNIVKTAHNISSNGNKTVLGLLVNSNTLSAANDSKIEVSHF